MVRPGTVVAGAAAIGALALIALLMGVFAAMPAKGGVGSCGHLFDPTRGGVQQNLRCDSALRDRRVEVTAAAVVVGAAAIVGLVSYAGMVKTAN
jgi:hypothetical protein